MAIVERQDSILEEIMSVSHHSAPSALCADIPLFCLLLQTFTWCCCLLQNMQPLGFILISLPSEEGIYVEEMVE